MHFLRNEYAAFLEGGGFGTVTHACERPWNSRILVFREMYYCSGKIDLHIFEFCLYISIQTERPAMDYLYTETFCIHFVMLKTAFTSVLLSFIFLNHDTSFSRRIRYSTGLLWTVYLMQWWSICGKLISALSPKGGLVLHPLWTEQFDWKLFHKWGIRHSK